MRPGADHHVGITDLAADIEPHLRHRVEPVGVEPVIQQPQQVVNDALMRPAPTRHRDDAGAIKLVPSFLPVLPGEEAFNRPGLDQRSTHDKRS